MPLHAAIIVPVNRKFTGHGPHGRHIERKAIMRAYKTVEVKTIRNTTLETAKPRAGIKCKLCGKPIATFDCPYTGDNAIKTHTPAEPVAYVHKGCIRCRGYGDDATDFEGRPFPTKAAGKATRGGWAITLELEGNAPYSQEKAAYLAATYGLIATEDCTVEVEWHQVNSWTNLHGKKTALEGIFDAIDPSGDNCGCHVNISWTPDDDAAPDFSEQAWNIQQNAVTLFSPLQTAMLKRPDYTKAIFGRGFGSYCYNGSEYSGHSWLSLDSLDSYDTERRRIEWRICHFQTPAQMFICLAFIKEACEIIRKATEQQAVSYEKAGKQIAKLFEKYGQGKGKAQRPERNNR